MMRLVLGIFDFKNKTRKMSMNGVSKLIQCHVTILPLFEILKKRKYETVFFERHEADPLLERGQEQYTLT